MEIKITSQISLKDIQLAFHQEFPYLKIEFFQSAHRAKESSPKKQMIVSEEQLQKKLTHIKPGSLFVFGDQTVKELEETLQIEFNIYAQVFRKSGKLWIETSLTDTWTLDRQNQEAFELSNGKYKFDIPEVGFDKDVDE